MRELQGAELGAERRESVFAPELRFKELYRELRARGTAQVGDRNTHVVEAVPHEGAPEKLYFDVESACS